MTKARRNELVSYTYHLHLLHCSRTPIFIQDHHRSPSSVLCPHCLYHHMLCVILPLSQSSASLCRIPGYSWLYANDLSRSDGSFLILQGHIRLLLTLSDRLMSCHDLKATSSFMMGFAIFSCLHQHPNDIMRRFYDLPSPGRPVRPRRCCRRCLSFRSSPFGCVFG